MKIGAIVWSERSVDPDMQELLRPYYIKQLAKLRIGPGNILFLHAGTAGMSGALEAGSMKLSEDGNSRAGDDLDPRSYINQFRKKGYQKLVMLEAPFWISDTQVLTDRLEGQKSPFMAIEDLDDEPEEPADSDEQQEIPLAFDGSDTTYEPVWEIEPEPDTQDTSSQQNNDDDHVPPPPPPLNI